MDYGVWRGKNVIWSMAKDRPALQLVDINIRQVRRYEHSRSKTVLTYLLHDIEHAQICRAPPYKSRVLKGVGRFWSHISEVARTPEAWKGVIPQGGEHL